MHIFNLICSEKCFNISNVNITYLFHLNSRNLIVGFLNVCVMNILIDKIDATHVISRDKNPLANSQADIWDTNNCPVREK